MRKLCHYEIQSSRLVYEKKALISNKSVFQFMNKGIQT